MICLYEKVEHEGKHWYESAIQWSGLYGKKGVIMPKQTLKGISIPSISGIDELVSGDFGELLVSYYLVKKKLHVIVAKSEGFDLLVNDTRGLLFEKDKLIGISVKTRQKRSLCLDLDIASDKLKRAAKIWKFIPYFCYVTPSEVIIFPADLAKDSRVMTGANLVSSARLKTIKDNRIIYFQWGIKERISGRKSAWLFEI